MRLTQDHLSLSRRLMKEEGKEGKKEGAESQRQWGTRADMCFRGWVGTGADRVSGSGTRLPGESGQPGRN